MDAEAYVELGWYFKFEEFEEKDPSDINAKPRHRFRVILVSPDGELYFAGVGADYDEAAAYALQKANDAKLKESKTPEKTNLENLTRS